MSTPTKLVYFNLTGLGEPVRYMLSYCGEEFIDERMTLDMDLFASRKDSFPFGKVPYIEIDGLCLHQSKSICRYLAQKHGVTGKTSSDAIKADIMVETLDDIREGLCTYFFEQDEAAKEKKKEMTLKNTDYYLDRLEKAVKYNGGYLVQGQMTWADVLFASWNSFFNHMAGKDLFADRPQLKALSDKIQAIPSIKKYIDSRPQHLF